MADLGNYTNTSEILKKHQFRMQKKYGQNFLIDANILAKIVEAAQITKEDWRGREAGDPYGVTEHKHCEEQE